MCIKVCMKIIVQHTDHVTLWWPKTGSISDLFGNLKVRKIWFLVTFVNQSWYILIRYDKTSRSYMKFVCIDCGVSYEAGVWGRLILLYYYLNSLNIVKLAIWNSVCPGTLDSCILKSLPITIIVPYTAQLFVTVHATTLYHFSTDVLFLSVVILCSVYKCDNPCMIQSGWYWCEMTK